MTDHIKNLDNLTPEAKRELLAKILAEKKQPGSPSPYPLSFAQERIWFLEQYDPGQPVFNMPLAYELTGHLNVAALQASLNEIIGRHDSLRTIFKAENGRPQQHVLPTLQIPLPHIHLQPGSPDHQQSQITRLRDQTFREPFNLETGPLLRGLLVQLRPEIHHLYLTFHHIIADGWSLDVFFQELVTLYQAFSTGNPSPLAPLKTQYRQHIHHQQQVASGEAYDEQLAYWQAALEEAPLLLSLPTDRPRPAIQTHAGQRLQFSIDPELTTAVKALCQSQQVTPFMLFLAAFNLLLSRYTGQADLLVGTPIAGRTEEDTEKLIGLFLNVLILRTQTNKAGTFTKLLHQLRQTALSAYEHQNFPIEKLIDEFDVDRDMSYSPLFQVWFAMQNQPWTGFELPGLTIRQLDAYTGTAKVDLSVYLHEDENGFEGILEYNTDLFDEPTMLRLAGHYQQLLRSAVSNPNQSLDTLSMLPTNEQNQLLFDWNQTNQPYPAAETIPSLFIAQVGRTPQAVAFISGSQTITFHALNRRANHIAHLLRSQGIGPGSIVGICLPRSLDLVAALLAILKTGAAYLPLDPSYPTDRLAFMANDAGIAALITTRSADILSAALNTPTIYLDEPTTNHQPPTTNHQPLFVSPDAIAYLIYTSGSTGRPKGVAVPHKQILNRLNWMWRDYPFQPGEVGCQRTALNFVDSIWEIFGPLLQGIPTVIVPDEVVQDPAEFVAALGEHNVSRLWLVPSLLRLMLDTMPDLAQRLPKLNFWVTSGETIPMELFQRFREQMPQATIFNLYGTSEVWDVTWYPPETAHTGLTKVPIGKPIDNVQCFILDNHLRPLPIGVPGELYVAGEGLAQGYIGRPSLTALTFVPHPFSQIPGARLNRTGDLARFLPDGHIEFLGRRDFQVKIRGFRVELGEIESALLQHPAVKSAVVVAPELQPGQRRLIAYIVSRTEPAPTVSELRDFLSQTLPEPMIPGLFIFLEQLPLTPNGKVNRQALPKPDSSRPELTDRYIAPRNSAESVVAAIWQEVLDLEQVGVRDNFFELGGHSLMATQITFKLQDTFRVQYPLHEVFNKPTVAGMVENLIQFWGDRELVEDIAQTWEQIMEMSAEEVGQLLKEEQSSDRTLTEASQSRQTSAP